ncbi:MAG TPA: DUF2155 domain-containing protein [Azospirillaceae bacterium]|nr:DUF2155 domain-containing protein [Azospirillaceae bacterium]
MLPAMKHLALPILLAVTLTQTAFAQAPATPEPPPAAGAPTPGPGVTLPPMPPAAPERTFEEHGVAVLQGLDKITASVSTFEAPIGRPVRFGGTEVVARACRKAPPVETPESAAFLEIVELKPDEGPVRLFGGWMFASSPALSALEHPVYDVWVLDCKKRLTSSSSSPQ